MATLIITAAFGLLWGSFLNVAAHRLPQIELWHKGNKPKSAAQKKQKPSLAYLAWPPSACPHCGAPIPPFFNIPVFGYLFLRGRAKCCGAKIGVHYMWVELLTGALAAAVVARFGLTTDAALAMVFLSFLIVASVIDLRRYYLLDILTLPLLWAGLAVNVDARFSPLPQAVVGAMGGYVGLALFSGVFSLLWKKRAMGGGDYKLLAALGAWTGVYSLPFILFLAAVAGLLLSTARFLARFIFRRRMSFAAAFASLKRGRGRHIPFAVCLAIAGAIMLFFGETITHCAFPAFILGNDIVACFETASPF